MVREEKISNRMDWITVLLYGIIVFWGWLNIFSVTYEENQFIFDPSINSGRQLIFIVSSIAIIMFILIMDMRFYETFAWVIYGVVLFLCIIVVFTGHEVGGNRAWLRIGSFGFQPSEFAKFATALAVAKYIGTVGFRMDQIRNQVKLFIIIGVPMAIILLQDDAGTALVFSAFVLVFYREGMSPFLILVGIGVAIIFILTLLVENEYILFAVIGGVWLTLVLLGKKKRKRIMVLTAAALMLMGTIKSVDFIFDNVLKEHQQKRIRVLLNPDLDQLGVGYHVYQSKVAIGSGGLWGKGFLKGTQTKLKFVPEQSTDFIFCTIGEEHGWIGSLAVILLFIVLLFRVVYLAERQKSRFARVYGYCVACILFFHFMINIGMTIGLFPVIGIPLPFFSYGGSSLWGFTILLFILLKLDAHRLQVMNRG
ncbi:MAG: rod shape-determining protein RodA [Bacteroidota bacterium]|jgi:rod shape determining protein RodA|nr:MAG: rod shape-determining protein RodA [Bacteroidota bacterium]